MLPLRCVSRNGAKTHFEVVFEELNLGPTLSLSKRCPDKGASKVITCTTDNTVPREEVKKLLTSSSFRKYIEQKHKPLNCTKVSRWRLLNLSKIPLWCRDIGITKCGGVNI